MLTGTPTAAGTSVVTIRGTDANGCFATIALTMVIAAAPLPPPVCPVMTITPGTLPNGSVGVAFNQTLAGNGGTPPYTFGVVAGALPAGVTLTSAGILAGTPTSRGTSEPTIRVTDSRGCFAEKSFSMLVTTGVPTLPDAFVVLLALGLMGLGLSRVRRTRSRPSR
jgi:large repetitive protein